MYGNSATTSKKWLKKMLYTVKPEKAYRQPASILQSSSRTQRRAQR